MLFYPHQSSLRGRFHQERTSKQILTRLSKNVVFTLSCAYLQGVAWPPVNANSCSRSIPPVTGTAAIRVDNNRLSCEREEEGYCTNLLSTDHRFIFLSRMTWIPPWGVATFCLSHMPGELKTELPTVRLAFLKLKGSLVAQSLSLSSCPSRKRNAWRDAGPILARLLLSIK